MTHNNRVLQFERLACILAPARTGGRPEPARVPVAISPGRTRNRRGARSGPRRVSLMFPVVGVVRPARLLSLGAAAPAAGTVTGKPGKPHDSDLKFKHVCLPSEASASSFALAA